MFSAIGRMAYDYNEKNSLTRLYENQGYSGQQSGSQQTKNILPELDLYFSKRISPKQEINVNIVGGYANYSLDYQYEEEREKSECYRTAFNASGDKYDLIGELKYNNRFSKNHRLSIGMKERHTWESDSYSNEVITRETDNNYLYAYAQLTGSHRKVMYSMGVAGSISRYYRQKRSFSFWSFLPDVSLGYRFSNRSMLRYKLEVFSEDPRISYLNDVTQVINPYLQSVGNEALSAYTSYRNSLTYTLNLK